MDRHQAAVHDALQVIVGDAETSGIPELDGAVLTGWVLVGEAMRADGERVIVRWSGPESITGWLRDGMLHEALYGSWADAIDGDDDDGDDG